MIMVVPMALLAIGATLAGLAGSPLFHHPLFRLLHDAHAPEGIDVPILLWSSLALAVGVTQAWTVGFQRRNFLTIGLRPLGRRLYAWAANAYHVDACYYTVLIQPVLATTRWLAQWYQQVIDGAVNKAGRLGAWISQWKERCDRLVVDGCVNGLARAVRGAGNLVRWVQTGIIQPYLLFVIVAVVVLSVAVRR